MPTPTTMRKRKPVAKEYTFTVFIEKTKGLFVAHALEAGMLAVADDQEEALFKVGKMLTRHIQFAEENERPEEIYRPSPQDVWERFARCKDQGEAKMLEQRSRFFAEDDSESLTLNQNAYAAYC